MAPRLNRQSRFPAVIWAPAFENVGAIRAVCFPADAAAKLVRGRTEIGSRLASVSDDYLTIAVHESDLRRSLLFPHAATILARHQLRRASLPGQKT